jgi:two-component system KDP operon response regulator KdpE
VAAALERGADDYITKPLALDELMARIRVRLRRTAPTRQAAESALLVGELEIDVSQRRVLRAGRLVHLTPTEYALLGQFTEHPDKLLTERMLRESVWGTRPVNGHLLQVYIARLRQKLELNPAAPSFLVTEPGSGYRLVTRKSR